MHRLAASRPIAQGLRGLAADVGAALSAPDGQLGRVSIANYHRLPCRTDFVVKPQLLHSSNPSALTPLNMLHLGPFRQFKTILSNVRAPELKLLSGMCSDNQRSRIQCMSVIPLLGGQRRYQNGWTQRAPICGTCFCIRTHCLCSYILILL